MLPVKYRYVRTRGREAEVVKDALVQFVFITGACGSVLSSKSGGLIPIGVGVVLAVDDIGLDLGGSGGVP